MISGHFERAEAGCKCGNIHVSARKHNVNPHLGLPRQLLKKMYENPNPVFQLHAGCIGISNVKAVVCRKLKNGLYYLCCRKCNEVFLVFVGRGSIFGQISNEKMKDRIRLSDAMVYNSSQLPPNEQFPPIICQLVTVDDNGRDAAIAYNEEQNESETDNDENIDSMFGGNLNDLDYDVMFSNNHEYLQNSYQKPSALGMYM